MTASSIAVLAVAVTPVIAIVNSSDFVKVVAMSFERVDERIDVPKGLPTLLVLLLLQHFPGPLLPVADLTFP